MEENHEFGFCVKRKFITFGLRLKNEKVL